MTLFVVASVFAVLVVFGGRFVVDRVSRALERRQEENDWILSTGLAPGSWYTGYQKRVDLLKNVGVGGGALEWMKDRYKRKLERRLYGMLRYVEESNVIQDDSIRRTMAATIRTIGRSWEESSWEEVTGQRDEGHSTEWQHPTP